MKTIVFGKNEYDLVSIDADSQKLCAVVQKENHTMDSIIKAVDGVESIVVYEDGEQIAVYNGYSKLFVAYYLKENDTVSVELSNTDIESQINNLSDSVTELNAVVDGLEDSQATQDLAIEDLAEAIDELTPTEE
jgi:hypothetical protein